MIQPTVEPARIWYVNDAGVNTGPFDIQSLSTRYCAGMIGPDSWCWREGLPEWLNVRLVIGMEPPKPSPPAGAPAAPVLMAKRIIRTNNPFARWKQAAGAKSFVFQVALAGWTVMFGVLAMLMLVSAAAPYKADYRYGGILYETPDQQRQSRAEGLVGGWCCLGSVWALVAVPLGIAAVATIEKKGQ